MQQIGYLRAQIEIIAEAREDLLKLPNAYPPSRPILGVASTAKLSIYLSILDVLLSSPLEELNVRGYRAYQQDRRRLRIWSQWIEYVLVISTIPAPYRTHLPRCYAKMWIIRTPRSSMYPAKR